VTFSFARSQVLVFENVLTSSECQWLVGQAEAAATTRGGWLGDRHRGYATTDLRTSHVSEAVWDTLEAWRSCCALIGCALSRLSLHCALCIFFV